MIYTKKWMVVPYESDDDDEKVSDDLLKINNMSDYDKINNYQNNLAKNEQKNYQKDNQLQSLIKKEEIADENENLKQLKIKKEDNESNKAIFDNAVLRIKQEIGDMGESLTERMRNEIIEMNNTIWGDNSSNQTSLNQSALKNTILSGQPYLNKTPNAQKTPVRPKSPVKPASVSKTIKGTHKNVNQLQNYSPPVVRQNTFAQRQRPNAKRNINDTSISNANNPEPKKATNRNRNYMFDNNRIPSISITENQKDSDTDDMEE